MSGRRPLRERLLDYLDREGVTPAAIEHPERVAADPAVGADPAAVADELAELATDTGDADDATEERTRESDFSAGGDDGGSPASNPPEAVSSTGDDDGDDPLTTVSAGGESLDGEDQPRSKNADKRRDGDSTDVSTTDPRMKDSHDAPECAGAPDSSQDPGDTNDTTPDDTDSPSSDVWTEAQFDAPDSETWPPALVDRDRWMLHGSEYPPHGRQKAPYAPWGDAENRAAWGTEANHASKSTADDFFHADPYADGWAFIQTDDDPLAFVDGDDVRDPETGDVHPAFVTILGDLGATYADISTSGSGVHAYYRGELPEGVKQAMFTIDDEPWGANDDPPTVEIYDGKHVCIATGEHVPETPVAVHDWDDDALETILDDHGELPAEPAADRTPVAHDTDRGGVDLDDYDPDATDATETTTNPRDVRAAVDDLRPQDLPLKTRQVGEDATGWEKWDPSSYRPSSSNESLHRPEKASFFHDHKTGEAFGVLWLFAAEQGIISNPWDPLKGEDWWTAIEAAREAGAPIPEYVGERGAHEAETTLVPALGAARLRTVDTAVARRYARERGLEWPTTDAVRDRVADALRAAFTDEARTILAPPTGAGKSYAVATTPWREVGDDVTGGRPVVHLHRTRETRNQLAQASADADDVDHHTLLSGVEACPVASGRYDPDDDNDSSRRALLEALDSGDREDGLADDLGPDEVVTIDGVPGSEWIRNRVENKRLPFSVVHAVAAEQQDQERDVLPCARDGPCQSEAQWEAVPTDDDGNPTADVVHATHGFAYVPSIRTHTNMVIDEVPEFEVDELDDERARAAIDAYLDRSEAGPDTYEELVTTVREIRGDPFDVEMPDDDAPTPGWGGIVTDRDKYTTVREALENDPPLYWYVNHPDAHALAPALARAVVEALLPREPFEQTGRASGQTSHTPPRFDDTENDGWCNNTVVTVVVDDANRICRVRAVPDLSQARAVVGLDAHPTPLVWEGNTESEMTVDPILDDDESRLWRIFERGLKIVQVGDADRPAGANGQFHDLDGDRAVLARLRGAGFDVSTAIAPKTVEDDVEGALGAAGADDPETMHYGEEKSRDDFAGEDAGYVTHTIDPGDDYVVNWLTECGLEARPERVAPEDVDDPDAPACKTCDGDGCRECGDTGRKRAHGRGFVGPDADAADQLLASVRATHVLQAAGRYARDAADPDDEAWVFVRTAVLPDSHVDLAVPGVQWTPTDCQAAILRALEDEQAATAREIAAAADVSREHVRQTLNRLVEEGQVRRRERAGDHGAHLYRALGGLRTTAGIVDFTPTGTGGDTDAGDEEESAAGAGGTSNAPVKGSNTGALAIQIAAPGTTTALGELTATGRRPSPTAPESPPSHTAGTGGTDDADDADSVDETDHTDSAGGLLPGAQVPLDAFAESTPGD